MPAPTNLVNAAATGAAAGAAGTLAMDLVWYARYRRDGGTDSFAAWDLSSGAESWDDAPASAKVGQIVVKTALKRDLPAGAVAATNNLVHWGTGTGWGALYGVVASVTGRRGLLSGLLLGTAAWATSYVVLPVLGVYEPIWKYDLETLAKELGAHLVYGVATAVAYQALTAGEQRVLTTA